MRSLRLVLLLAFLPAVPVVAAPVASFGQYRPQARFDGIDSRSFYVRLRDGVRVAVRVDRPTTQGVVHDKPLPVIWHHSLSVAQLPADGAGGRNSGYRAVPSLTRHGYVVVQVARRGNGQSLGAMRGYHDRMEAQDAFEMIDWLSRQPWSNGRVGMYGCSNTGDAAMQALTMRPPALKAVFAGCFSWHKFDAFRRGGIFAQWGTGPTRSIAQDMAIPPVDDDADKTLLAQAAQEHQLSTPLFAMWSGLPFRDSHSALTGTRFWSEGSSASYAQQVRLAGVPLYIQGAWRDELRDQAFITHLNVPGSRVIIGPWLHCDSDDFALLDEMHRFFDRHLKDIDTGLDDQAPIHYYTVNAPAGREWRSAQTWPLPQQREQTLHLTAGKLAERPATSASAARFAVRPVTACATAGEGSRIQPCHMPEDGARFTGSVLKAAVEVTGHPRLRVWVASTQPDANVFAYLEDVAPDGSVRVVTEGRLKASLRREHEAPWAMPAGIPWHRAYAEDAQPLQPGVPVELHFDLMPTSWLFQAGHRMQVTVTGADHRERGRSDLLPTLTVLGDAAHPSALLLPVMAQP